ncbi:MAG: hypothetical protein ACT4PZ_15020 [Panacagrimonas sp.]
MRKALPLQSTLSAALLLALSPMQASALDFDFDFVDDPQQADFKSVVEDVGALLNAKSLSPAEAGGITGFSIGAFAAYVPTDDGNAWRRLIGEEIDEIGTVGVIAQKGLPFGIDVGAAYSWVPGSDISVLSAEVRYAFLEGGVATPALGLRASYSRLEGVDELDYDSYGLDLSVSKGFGPLTPYAGVGYVFSTFDPDPVFGLDDEDVDETRIFIGLRLSALIGITPEYERVGDRDSFNLRFGFAF